VIETRDPGRLEARLRQEPTWAAYSLGDLEEPFFSRTRWFLSDKVATALIMRFDFGERVTLMSFGPGPAVADLLPRIGVPQPFDLHYPEDQAPALDPLLVGSAGTYLRMAVTPSDLRQPPPTDGIEWRFLSPDDLEATLAIYRHYPDNFFEPARLEQRGVLGGMANGELVTVAGTHVCSTRYRVAAIGDVVTIPAWRGRGLGGEVTARLTGTFFEAGIELVVLNVAEANDAARRAYARIGFGGTVRHREGFDLRLR
jgi:RimJ/RimL family protein N-acetyltransferase